MENIIGLVVSLVFLFVGCIIAARLAMWKAKKDHEEFVRSYKKFERK